MDIFFVFAAFLAASVTDLRTRTIPNVLPLLLACSAAVSCAMNKIPLYVPLLNGLAALLFLLILALFGDYLLQRKGRMGCSLGGGDIKLLAAASCCIGFLPALIILLISQLALAAWLILQKVRRKQKPTATPLAPFLLASLVIAFLLQQNLANV